MRASQVKPRAVDWLWWPYVPLGKITALAGQMGQAKSLATCYLASAVTRGSGINLSRPASAIILNAEDDPEDTIRPRLEAAGADLNRIWIEPNVALDAVRLAAICDEMVDPRLLTIDPIQAYLPGNVNAWKGQDVRQALEPIRQLAAERKLAVVLVQHLNRRTDAGDPLARIADSQGIPQLARSVLIWGPDPSDTDGDQGSTKVLTRAKGNLARAKDSATFTITEKTVTGNIKAPALVRGDDREISADDVVQDVETRTAVEEAAAWLREQLAAGPVGAKEITKRAAEVGFSTKTLNRAKKVAGVVSRPHRDESQEFTAWKWSLKDPIYPNDHLGHVGHVGHVAQTQMVQVAQIPHLPNGPEGNGTTPDVQAWAKGLLTITGARGARDDLDDLCPGHGRSRDANGICTYCNRPDLRRAA